MDKKEFKDNIKNLLDSYVEEVDWDEKIAIIRQSILELEWQLGFGESNKGRPWSDDELRLILRTAPTKENFMRLARTFR